jgi:mannose-6-phosphate isomerase
MWAMKAYPLKFKPIYKERIWGGRKLAEVFGKELPEGVKIGESWELADLPEDKSVVANGELAGRTIAWVLESYPEQITGYRGFEGGFPLLIKLLDAEEVLSVQVHPDAETCRRMGKGEPKTECWYIISAEAGSVIYKGLKKGVDKEQFAEAIQTGRAAELLEEVAVAAGELHFLAAGTPHSIGAGLLIAEIQTPSDTTYRVFDWNRVDGSGKSRTLHIEEALESIHFEAAGEAAAATEIGRLVDCEYFRIDKGHMAADCELLLSPGEVKVMMFLSGAGVMLGTAAGSVEYRAGDTVLVPAAYEGAVRIERESRYLTVTI